MRKKKPPYNCPEWYDKKISDSLNLPIEGNYKKYNLKFDKSIKIESYYFTKNKNKLDIPSIPKIDIPKQTIKIQEGLQKSIKKINDNENLTKEKKITNIKTATTKSQKKIRNIDKTTICHQYLIYPTNEQKKILDIWFSECTKVYNKCVDVFIQDNKYFDKGYKMIKAKFFKDHYNNINNVPKAKIQKKIKYNKAKSTKKIIKKEKIILDNKLAPYQILGDVISYITSFNISSI